MTKEEGVGRLNKHKIPCGDGHRMGFFRNFAWWILKPSAVNR